MDPCTPGRHKLAKSRPFRFWGEASENKSEREKAGTTVKEGKKAKERMREIK